MCREGVQQAGQTCHQHLQLQPVQPDQLQQGPTTATARGRRTSLARHDCGHSSSVNVNRHSISIVIDCVLWSNRKSRRIQSMQWKRGWCRSVALSVVISTDSKAYYEIQTITIRAGVSNCRRKKGNQPTVAPKINGAFNLSFTWNYWEKCGQLGFP